MTTASASAGDAVQLVDVSKYYGRVEALRGVSVTIKPGEVVAMLGPNGAGKTTAISLMLGMRRPTAGRVRLFDLDPGDRAARSRCGVMLQESGVNDVLRVGETVAIFRAYYPHPLATARVLELAGLEAVANRKITTLSGGQRQRLYYALAICGNPEALFLDEPTAGMDVESRRAFLGDIRRCASEGRTVVLSTHYLEEVDQVADRVVVIDRGVIIADDSPAAIKSKVAGRRVTFTVTPSPTPADFAGLPISGLELRDKWVRFHSSQPEQALAASFRRGWDIQNLEVVGADLEEAFVNLTGNRGADLARSQETP
ncbi:MAG TPA: ABC transporter ATP-binding protein [Verrucomicrobiae bacterium]|nr:ABC transporter ATP-binding protein [Verrucomicrobiae bacterium]